jgi:hypothetical protein
MIPFNYDALHTQWNLCLRLLWGAGIKLESDENLNWRKLNAEIIDLESLINAN